MFHNYANKIDPEILQELTQMATGNFEEFKARSRLHLVASKIDPDSFYLDIEPLFNNQLVSSNHLVAEAKVSRFHKDAIETLSKDVNMIINLSIKQKSLLVDARLILNGGTRYGLVGRNGIGKTVLFHSIDSGQLTGFPANLRVYHVKQIDSLRHVSVFDFVVDSNSSKKRLKSNIASLTNALDNNDISALLDNVRSIKIMEAGENVDQKAKIATFRSRARGKKAREELKAAEQKLQLSKMEQLDNDELIVQAQEILNDGVMELEGTGMVSEEKRARHILENLGFCSQMQQMTVDTLSGGWKMKASLAQALFLEPDLLLLDEPTNHLDFKAIFWLRNHLKTIKSTIVIISHDVEFLNETTEETILFKDQQLYYYQGNYDQMRKAIDDKFKLNTKQSDGIERKKAHIAKSIQAGMASAKKSGDSKKLRAVAAKKKKLERVGIEKNEKGHRFKLSRDRIGYFDSVRSPVDMDSVDPPVVLKLPEPTIIDQCGSIFEMENVSFGYTHKSAVLKNVTLNIQQGQRVAFVGANGQGKTTLIKLISGQIAPTSGRINYLSQAKIRVLDQDSVQVIKSQEGTPIDYLRRINPNYDEKDYQAILGIFGIGAIARNSLYTLSGGQTTRVALSAVFMDHPNLLILDEPTNHLDLDTVMALVEGLQAFQGAIVFVSHDQYFCQNVANLVYLVHDCTVRKLEGGFDDYVDILEH
jgi:ATP-binding cassette subfamily F protein 3